MNYAQINPDNNKVIGVHKMSENDLPNLIKIDSYNTSLIGMIYNSETKKFEPDLTPAPEVHTGNYSDTVAYAKGQIVTRDDVMYKALQDTVIGIAPPNSAYWKVWSYNAEISELTDTIQKLQEAKA